MNNSESAKKGFKTFVLTLSISLIIFSAIYYFLTNYSAEKKPLENQVSSNETAGKAQDVQGVTNERVAAEPVTEPDTNTKSVFKEIASKKTQAKPQVLGGSATATSQTTTSTPTTGVVEITIGLMVSFLLFVAGLVIISKNPRKVALTSFEKGIIQKSN